MLQENCKYYYNQSKQVENRQKFDKNVRENPNNNLRNIKDSNRSCEDANNQSKVKHPSQDNLKNSDSVRDDNSSIMRSDSKFY